MQKTDYPTGNEMVLSCELDDVRYKGCFYSYSHVGKKSDGNSRKCEICGRPSEYCEIFRKWKNGDEIVVKLNN